MSRNSEKFQNSSKPLVRSVRWGREGEVRGCRSASSRLVGVGLVASRRRMESGVRFLPRRGLVDSKASRYWRTTRPSSRPLANAALWVSDMGVFLRDFVEVVAAIR